MSQSPTHNPYEATAESGWSEPTEQAAKKPAAITVFGILNLVFGVMGVVGLLGSAFVFFMMPRGTTVPNPTLDLLDQGGPYAWFTYASMIAGGIATIVLIVAGFGLLMSKSFGRTLSIVYAVYTIIMGVVGMLVNYVYVFAPMLDQWNAGNGTPQQAALLGGLIGGVIGGLIGLIFPVLLLVFMTRPRIKAYLSDTGTSPFRG